MSGYDYPVALALEDYVPVLLTGAGLALLVPYARRFGTAPVVALGAVLATAGGLSKATWKLVVALDGPDLHWLNSALFPLLCTAFLLLLYAFHRPRDARRRAALTAGLAVLFALGQGACVAVGDTWPAMALMIVAVSVLTVRFVMLARAAGDVPAVVLFSLWQIGQYLLGPMAARADQSVTLQWVEQSCNTVAQGAFAVATWRLAHAPGAPISASTPASTREVPAA
ncbi:hypothetical protein SAMN04489712_106191 [Thermomonospora echinospora]|uniref:YhhN-like protein n=1 Tax=Thermomonospora echinospora TaxID=1992 RepID=A0A1H6B3Z5_9ACTN|nr:hypothetical protein [Thermomonospora echinospora]SEG54947.1 hypothetical protein SAMN04489712_106191 [Thermomonospora echinospora]